MTLEDYQKELNAALAGLKQDLSRVNNTVGMIETFIYLIRRESNVISKDLEEVKHGK